MDLWANCVSTVPVVTFDLCGCSTHVVHIIISLSLAVSFTIFLEAAGETQPDVTGQYRLRYLKLRDQRCEWLIQLTELLLLFQ